MNQDRHSDNHLSSNHIIVTGATGFVGRHVVKSLIQKNYAVTALVRNLEKAAQIEVLKNLNVIQFNINDPTKKVTIPSNATLIHCAWEDVRNTLQMSHLEKHFMNNYLFLKNMVHVGIKNIIVTGTCYEYGLQYGPISAQSSTTPNTPYALAKDNLHKSLRMLQQHASFNLVWARLFYTYGEGQDENSVMQLFDKALEENAPDFNLTYCEQLFDYLPIEKVAEYLTSLLICKNGVFNICKGEPISLRRLLENRMKERKKYVTLNLGHHDYRKQDSLAIWGKETFEQQLNSLN